MICPNCQNEQSITEHNFGALYTCKACQAVYFISFDGIPEYSPVVNEVAEEVVNDVLPPPSAPSSVDFSNSNQFESLQFEALPVEQALESTNSQPAFSSVAQEIAEFGNSESQIASLNYDLKVSGLDNAETRKLFCEAVDDLRFGWDINEINHSIKDGEISFTKLNPVKAYVLAKRLQFLSIEKKWTQHAIAQIFLAVVSTLLLFNSTKLFANEHGEKSASESSASGKNTGAVNAEYSGKQSQKWAEVQMKLAALKTKLDAQEAVVRSMMLTESAASSGHGAPAGGGHGAASAAGSAVIVNKFDQLKKEHEKLQALMAEYNKLSTEYETKFPEKGIKESRIYKRSDVSVEAAHAEKKAPVATKRLDLYEEKLQELQNKIMQQYPRTAKKLKSLNQAIKAEQSSQSSHKAPSEKNHQLKPAKKSDDVTEQIILQK